MFLLRLTGSLRGTRQHAGGDHMITSTDNSQFFFMVSLNIKCNPDNLGIERTKVGVTR